MNVLIDRFKEILLSVFPITAIVLILNFTLVPLEIPQMLRFLLGALFIVLGLSIFLFGVDLGITPIGNLMGSHLVKTNKIAIVAIGIGLLLSLGFARIAYNILCSKIIRGNSL